MRTLGRLLLIVFSSLALALNAVMIGLGWERILFYTGWINKSFAYPAAILFLIAIFGLTNFRLNSTIKTAAVMALSTVLAIVLMIGFTMVNIAYNYEILQPFVEFFNMTHVLVEEEPMNYTAVTGAIVYPLLWLIAVVPATRFVRRF